MISSCSSTRSRSASVRGLMPGHERSSSEKRRGPSDRSWTSSAVHFEPMISAHAATAHEVTSWVGFIVRIPRLYSGKEPDMRRITCSDLGFGACKHVIEAVRDEELLERARAHVREKHGVELDEDVARRLLA